jgi:hypothetical protein
MHGSGQVLTAPLLRAARHLPDRVLHPLRRRGALRELERMRPPPRTLLVACRGNVCRSPFAAGVLRGELRGRDMRVESAGFVGLDRRPPAEALAAAGRPA